MSRSYRKTPISKDKNNRRIKKLSNKKIRKTKNIGNGSQFKRILDGWTICDFRLDIGMSFSQWLEDELKREINSETDKDWRDYYRQYRKEYINK